MRIVVGMMGAALLAVPAQARLIGPGMAKSWGKPGISFAQYREDGLACARETAAMDLSKSDPARALVIASRLIENDPTVGPGPTIDPRGGPAATADAIPISGSASTIQAIGPGRQILRAGDIMTAHLDQCLARLGYTRFKLIGPQRHRLRALREGSDERRAYLHSLASDPEVLARQRVE